MLVTPNLLASRRQPEATLKAFAHNGEDRLKLPVDGGDCEEVLADEDQPHTPGPTQGREGAFLASKPD